MPVPGFRWQRQRSGTAAGNGDLRQVATLAFGYRMAVPGTAADVSTSQYDSISTVPGTGPRDRNASETARPPIAPTSLRGSYTPPMATGEPNHIHGPERSLTDFACAGIRRRWRHFRRRWWWHGMRFIYHEAYKGSLEAVPLDPLRAEKVLSFLADEGLLLREDIRLPRHPSLRNLLRVHDAEYLASLQDSETMVRIFGTPVTDEELERVVEMQRMMVGGTILSTILALRNRGIAVNLGGGLHHAYRDAGGGFCLFNDIAVAIARLRAKGFKEPVLVVDLDMHDGNGTRSIFARDNSVYTYSLHAEHWTDPEAEASTAIALGNDVGDEVMLGTLLKTLPDVVDSVRPGLVVYVAATDGAESDALGSWQLSDEGLLRRDQFVFELVRGRGRSVPVVVVLGGGYGVHAWKPTARFVVWKMTGKSVQPPENEQLLLQRFRRIRHSLDPSSLTTEPGDFGWSFSEEDLAGILPEAPRLTRFLDYFSRHGVELVLERFGILDQLRVRGFDHPTLDVDLGHPMGQTVRIYSDPDRRELLIELRANRSTRVVPGLEVLIIEWLLLQNPRADFGPYRRPLPGQSHPGLGMLKETLGWLVMVCEMLDLDGIYYAPSSYHVAAQSRRLVRFLHPEHEAHFRAYQDALAGLTLSGASRAVDDGRLVDARTGEPVRWEGFPMVLPVSDRLEEMVFGEEYEAEVAEEYGRVSYRLADHPVEERTSPVMS